MSGPTVHAVNSLVLLSWRVAVLARPYRCLRGRAARHNHVGGGRTERALVLQEVS